LRLGEALILVLIYTFITTLTKLLEKDYMPRQESRLDINKSMMRKAFTRRKTAVINLEHGIEVEFMS
jgi:hypothetical protein